MRSLASRLGRYMQSARALEVMLSAEHYDAQLAERYGWIIERCLRLGVRARPPAAARTPWRKSDVQAGLAAIWDCEVLRASLWRLVFYVLWATSDAVRSPRSPSSVVERSALRSGEVNHWCRCYAAFTQDSTFRCRVVLL